MPQSEELDPESPLTYTLSAIVDEEEEEEREEEEEEISEHVSKREERMTDASPAMEMRDSVSMYEH